MRQTTAGKCIYDGYTAAASTKVRPLTYYFLINIGLYFSFSVTLQWVRVHSSACVSMRLNSHPCASMCTHGLLVQPASATWKSKTNQKCLPTGMPAHLAYRQFLHWAADWSRTLALTAFNRQTYHVVHICAYSLNNEIKVRFRVRVRDRVRVMVRVRVWSVLHGCTDGSEVRRAAGAGRCLHAKGCRHACTQPLPN